MPDQTTTLSDLRLQVAQFVAERQWEVYHTPKSLSMSIAIEAAELMEHFQWRGNQASHDLVDSPAQLQQVADELADVLIYCLALANVLQLDLGHAVEAKLAHNRRRFPPTSLPSRQNLWEET